MTLFPKPKVLKPIFLYKTIRVGYFCVTYRKNTNMLVSFATADANFSRHLTQNPQRESVEYRLRWVPPDAKPKICVTPDANPRRQSVEYRWRLVPNAKSSCWACTFHVVYVNFICVGHPTQTRFSVEYGL